MQKITLPPTLSLYIHIPWCIRKCPYCDFNSHQAGKNIPEDEYIAALIDDLDRDLELIWGRKIISIFIGGGTPSLFSAKAIETLIKALYARLSFHPNIEITMEANPSTFEQQRFADFRQAGINRLSVGVQSFQDNKLKALGRIHDANEAKKALAILHKTGFDNFNIDLMHGLPKQSVEDALSDLKTAMQFNPPHLSWYQLTLEPNTVFAKHPPKLPSDDHLWGIQEAGLAYLEQNNLNRYEVSAFSKPHHASQHNLNYWQFGDYLGIGAGAHSKLTNLNQQSIIRMVKTRNPRDYLNQAVDFTISRTQISREELPLEFMMNALRLVNGVSMDLFKERTGLSEKDIEQPLGLAKEKGLIETNHTSIKTTELGFRFLNDCLALF